MDRHTRYMVIAMKALAGIKHRHEGPKYICLSNALDERDRYTRSGWLTFIKEVQVKS